jgi:hypothetical protein
VVRRAARRGELEPSVPWPSEFPSAQTYTSAAETFQTATKTRSRHRSPARFWYPSPARPAVWSRQTPTAEATPIARTHYRP